MYARKVHGNFKRRVVGYVAFSPPKLNERAKSYLF